MDPAPSELPGEITVLYAVRLTREKRGDLFVAAYPRVRALDPRLHLVPAGGGPEEDVRGAAPGRES